MLQDKPPKRLCVIVVFLPPSKPFVNKLSVVLSSISKLFQLVEAEYIKLGFVVLGTIMMKSRNVLFVGLCLALLTVGVSSSVRISNTPCCCCCCWWWWFPPGGGEIQLPRTSWRHTHTLYIHACV